MRAGLVPGDVCQVGKGGEGGGARAGTAGPSGPGRLRVVEGAHGGSALRVDADRGDLRTGAGAVQAVHDAASNGSAVREVNFLRQARET